jgi:acyl-CoA synthetase (NDP forming)
MGLPFFSNFSSSGGVLFRGKESGLNHRRDLSFLFNPRSIALVGVPRGFEPGRVFLQGLLDQGYSGKVFPINPKADSIDGCRTYPSLKDVPGDIDLAILLLPAALVLPALEECSEKGVKIAVIYTSGFAETGDEEGKRREAALLQAARKRGIRLIGPNCMGIYHPKNGMAFFPGMPKEPGKVGMISQSGSLAILLSRLAGPQGIHFSKIISTGNESDLNSSDFLFYLGEDPETEVVGAYLEGVKDGPGFLQALQAACRQKPVVIWKAGRTPKGAMAASSHTGSLAGSKMAWEALKEQTGAILARDLEEFIDILTAFYYLPGKVGRRLAILSGPGGPAVSAADACEEFGLQVADLQEETRRRLKAVLPQTGTSANNPVDLGLASIFQVDLYGRAAEIVGEDPGVDALLLQGRGATAELDNQYARLVIETRKKVRKPFMAISLGGMYLEEESRKALLEAGIPVYPSAERALWAYSRLFQDGERRLAR